MRTRQSLGSEGEMVATNNHYNFIDIFIMALLFFKKAQEKYHMQPYIDNDVPTDKINDYDYDDY